MKYRVLIGAFVVAIELEGSAQTMPVDTIHITGRADRMATAAGGEAGMQWVRTVSEKSGFHVGGARGSMASDWWLSGQVGGHRRWRAVIASGAVDLGRAAGASGRFGYGRYKAGFGIPVLPKVVVEAEAQYVSLPRRASQHVYRSSVAWNIHSSSTLQGSYHRLSSHNGGSDLFSGRIDVTSGRVSWIGGVMLGPSRHSDPLELQLNLIPPSREFFGGCRFHVRGHEISTVLDVSQSAVRVARVLVGIGIPLNRRKE